MKRNIAAFAVCLLVSMAAWAQERQEKTVVWAEVDGVTVPLPPKEHPRVFVRAEEIPALKERMAHAEGKKIISKLQKASVPRTPEEEAAEKDRGFRYYAKMRGLTSKVQLQALDYLVTLPQWDGKRVLIYGESQGGAQAMALSGIDERVGACVAIVPAMNDLGASIDGRPASWPGARDSKINADNTEVTDQVLPYYDAALLSTMSKADYWVEIGLADTTCPAPAIWSACNVIKGDVTVSPFPFRTHYVPGPTYYDQWKATCFTQRYEWIENYLK